VRQVCWAVLLVGCFLGEGHGAESYLPPYEIGKLRMVERQGDFVVFHAQRASVRVNFVSDSIIRILVDQYRRFEDRPSAKSIFDGNKYQAAIPIGFEETASAVSMNSSRLRLTMEKTDPLRFVFEDSAGTRLTRIVKPVLTGGIHSDYHRVRFEIAPDEQFYGLGERFHSFNHRGREITLRNVDAINQLQDHNYFSIPFFLSSRGYGIFYNNTWDTTFHFGSESRDELSFESPGPNCDFFFIYGPTPRETLAAYLDLTGRPPLLPRYALGLWMGDFPYENQERISRIGQEFIDHQLPWDNFYLDYEWANTFFDFKFSPTTTPYPEDLAAWFRHHHRQLALIETPFVNAECPLYAPALERKLFCDPFSAWWHTPTNSGQIDFSNPEAARWWWQLHEPLVRMGVAFFVTDDGEFTREKALTSDGVSGGELHNYYSLLYARGMFEEMEKTSNLRGFICSRSGFAGSQKYGAFFAGDQDTEYRNLQKVTRAVLSSGLSGMPLLRTDLAGLFGELDPQSYARFTESQTLHPMLMLFPYIPSNVSSNAYAGKLDRRPWTYGEQTLQIFRKYLQLRHSLVPYLYTLLAEAHAAGTPLVRPLLFEYPQDSQSWGIEDEYLVGTDLLVAPVMNKDTVARPVYLAAGTEWVDFWSDRVYAGGQTINYEAPLDVLPLLVRRGAILPFQDPLLTLVDHPYPELTWRIYPSSETERFVLYEDDGLTQDYKQGNAVHTEVSAAGGGALEIRLRADGQRDRKHTLEVHLLAKRPRIVTVAGRRVKVQDARRAKLSPGATAATWDEARKTLTVLLPRLPEEGIIVRAE
jgi:alpha-glucosidase (family GH31 glycosyl hydrolase)